MSLALETLALSNNQLTGEYQTDWETHWPDWSAHVGKSIERGNTA